MKRITTLNPNTNQPQTANLKYTALSDTAIARAEAILRALVADRDWVESRGATWSDVASTADTARQLGELADRLQQTGEYAPRATWPILGDEAGR